MKKFKKDTGVDTGIIPLAKGYGLIVPHHSDSKEIMVAIGMLIQIWTMAELEYGDPDIEKLKKCICEYADVIVKEVKKGKIK